MTPLADQLAPKTNPPTHSLHSPRLDACLMSLKLDPPINAPNSDLRLVHDGSLTGNPESILTLLMS